MRNVNKNGLDLIKHFESFFARPYIDPVGIPTIGYGTIAYPDGRRVSMSDKPISLERAIELLDWELDEKEKIIQTFLEKHAIALSENQFSALVSFAYNLGPGPIIDSTKSMCIALKSRDTKKIADAFLLYNKGKVKKWGITRMVVLAGLDRRRKAERALFLTPDEQRLVA